MLFVLLYLAVYLGSDMSVVIGMRYPFEAVSGKLPELIDIQTAEDIHGTWRTSGIAVDGVRFTMEQIEAMGEKDSVDIIMVICEDGTLYGYSAHNNFNGTTTWTKGSKDNSLVVDNTDLYINDGEIVVDTGGGTVYLQKISDRQDKDIIDELVNSDKETITEVTPETKNQETEQETKEETASNTIRPEVKESIDAYEKFVDEYIAFMEKYKKSDGTDISALMDYAKFVSNLTEYTNKMEALEGDLTDAETFYYIEVMNRCNEKMMKAAY